MRTSIEPASDTLARASRRTFLIRAGSGAGVIAAGVAVDTPARAQAPSKEMTPVSRAEAPHQGRFWPDDIRLVVSISMQFEAGTRCRMMSVSAHDRISGSPQMVRIWDRVSSYVTPRLGRTSPSCARTRSPATHSTARSPCAKPKRSDPCYSHSLDVHPDKSALLQGVAAFSCP
jgi:hypothetical protein